MRKYSHQKYDKEHMARAYGDFLKISKKHAVEVCRMLRGKELDKAKQMLNRVIKKEMAVPFKRADMDLAHKKGMAAGRYPVKCSKEILKLLEGAEANAQFLGLDTSSLVIRSIIPHKAATTFHYGRKRGRKAKRTHIEIVLEEVAKTSSENKKKEKKAGKKEQKESVRKEENSIKKEENKKQNSK